MVDGSKVADGVAGAGVVVEGCDYSYLLPDHSSVYTFWYEPTDVNKASKPWNLHCSQLPSFVSPNLNEFNAIIRFISKDNSLGVSLKDSEYPRKIISLCKTYIPSIEGLMVTLGATGFMIVRWCRSSEEDSPLFHSDQMEFSSEEKKMVGLYFNPTTTVPVTSVSGAGDCLASGFIAGMLEGRRVSECAFLGSSCADLSLQASEAVPRSMNPQIMATVGALPYSLIEM